MSKTKILFFSLIVLILAVSTGVTVYFFVFSKKDNNEEDAYVLSKTLIEPDSIYTLSTKSMEQGAEYKVVLTYSPINAILDFYYESSNESVIKVDGNGIITAVGIGTATLTVYGKTESNKILKTESVYTVISKTEHSQIDDDNVQSQQDDIENSNISTGTNNNSDPETEEPSEAEAEEPSEPKAEEPSEPKAEPEAEQPSAPETEEPHNPETEEPSEPKTEEPADSGNGESVTQPEIETGIALDFGNSIDSPNTFTETPSGYIIECAKNKNGYYSVDINMLDKTKNYIFEELDGTLKDKCMKQDKGYTGRTYVSLNSGSLKVKISDELNNFIICQICFN